MGNINSQVDNKRIAKNSLILFFRLFCLLGVSLYTSRIILEILGVQNFGIYNLVASMVTMFTFFQGSLTNVTQRYLNIALGKEDLEEAKIIFKQSLTLFIGIALLFVIIGEIIGQSLIFHKLAIPSDRVSAASILLHFSILTIAFNICQIPYMSAIIARERMGIYAFLGILQASLQLSIVFLLKYHSLHFDKLIFYGASLSFLYFVIFLVHMVYCRITIVECRFAFLWDKKLIKGMAHFIGFNIFNCVGASIGFQAADILLNLFFGTLANASRGIAEQVKGGVDRFVFNLTVAGNPQIVKMYAIENYDEMYRLTMRLSKLSFFFMLLLSLPLLYSGEFVLNLWLKNVPQYSVVFLQIILVETLFRTIGLPFITVINATGRVKSICLLEGLMYLFSCPLSYILLKLGFPVITPLVVLMVVQLIFTIFLFIIAQRKIHFSFSSFFRILLVPILVVVVLLNGLLYFEKIFIHTTPYFYFGIILITDIVFGLFIIYLLGLSSKERISINNLIFGKIFKLKR